MLWAKGTVHPSCRKFTHQRWLENARGGDCEPQHAHLCREPRRSQVISPWHLNQISFRSLQVQGLPAGQPPAGHVPRGIVEKVQRDSNWTIWEHWIEERLDAVDRMIRYWGYPLPSWLRSMVIKLYTQMSKIRVHAEKTAGKFYGRTGTSAQRYKYGTTGYMLTYSWYRWRRERLKITGTYWDLHVDST